MSKDPFYHDAQQEVCMAGDPQIMAKVPGLLWAKAATGFGALVLLGAIWLVWRFG